jgi:hypothetical protein
MTVSHSMVPCAEPSVASRVLDAVRHGGCLSGANLVHVDGCASCRGAVEQARRVAEVWTGMNPSDAELRRARARFFAARASRRKPKVAPASLAFAVLLVAAAASAAVRVGMKYLHSSALRGESTSVRAGAHTGIGPGAAASTPDPIASASTDPGLPIEALAPMAAPAPSHDTTSSGYRAPASEAVARKAPAAASHPAAVDPNAKPSPTPADTAQAWAAAAEALRATDYPRAEAAFAELTRTGDAHTRDAARLARAQVWLAQGRVTEARPELEDLATNGATAGLRSRAQAAIERLR